MSNTDYYRRRAAECQRHADAAESASAGETLRDIAEKYLALAANEEHSAAMLDVAMKRSTAPMNSPRSRR